MKIFIKKIILFVLILAVLSFSIPLFYDGYKTKVAGKEIYHSLKKAKSGKKCNVVVIGDSVGDQLFPNTTYNDSIYSLTSNQAISLIGQFLILKEFFKNDGSAQTVALIYSPFNFANDLDQPFTYHYFLKPFYKKENFPFYTDHAWNKIREIPFYQYSQLAPILTTNWAPKYQINNQMDTMSFSQISIEYLNKIKQLAKENNCNLKLIAPPTQVVFQKQVQKLKSASDSIKELDFQNYFNTLSLIESEKFIDMVHLKEPANYRSSYVRLF